MRSNYDARKEHEKEYWLGVSGTVLFVATIVGCLLHIIR